MHRTLLLIAALAAALVACSPDKGFKSEQVGRTDYGEAWPLTVADALLVCDPGGVPTVQVDGRAYGLRNVATPEETEKGLRRIWVNDPDGVGGKKDMTILLENALDLCE